MSNSKKPCPCQSGKSLEECCLPLVEGKAQATSPEQLMRSRYTAFALKKIDYIFNTLDPQARGDFDRQTNVDWAEQSTFTNLEIVKSTMEGNKGIVEFKATFQTADGQSHVHHEHSKFRKQGGVWYFREGRNISGK